ncbi:hypothetical protein O181_019407 [Austropuccinia psidii MF-1]|uniref:Uncharacterized protein n=1 Tax=Austropuccinia psidii MF-1 TaxID=1389203 RepID=A0A9Q3C9N5_9BASI|nr:hypothetical protein [Austropuccinia psidii MF-1]
MPISPVCACLGRVDGGIVLHQKEAVATTNPRGLLHTGYERKQAWSVDLLNHLGRGHSPVEKKQRRLHCRTKCPPYHEALTTQSMVDSDVLKVPLLLRRPPDSYPINLFPKFKCRLIRPNNPGLIIYHPMAVGLGKGKAPLEIFRPEIWFFGSNAQMLTQFVDLALDCASQNLVSHQVGDLCNR